MYYAQTFRAHLLTNEGSQVKHQNNGKRSLSNILGFNSRGGFFDE
jgi:hypothetical protein